MNFILKLSAVIYTHLMRRLERKIGYRVTFKQIPDTWINGWMTFGMERSWAKHNINALGVNYFTLGAITEDGISSRFVRSKKQYQSWLGAYLVKFKNKTNFTLQDHYNLAIADQKNWLDDFGDPNPFMQMPEQNTTKAEDITVGGYEGKLYEFLGGLSHSDVGGGSDNLYNKIIMVLTVSMFNKVNPQLNLKMNSFIPNNFSTNYETVILKGYIAIIDLEENIKVILYGNGATLVDKGGQKIDYYPLLKQDILDAFRSVEITKV